jgi:capsular exopolysaccharide synthesis family protein
MSRIDEALRRVARADASPDVHDEGTQPVMQTAALDVSVLDRYVPEEPANVAAPQRPQVPATPARDAAPLAPIDIPAKVADKLVIGPGVSPMIVEQYRRLAAALHDLQAQHGLRSLMVTSATPQEGKTLTISNLALTLSESYHQRVLLIDMDLRRPSVHEVFGIRNGTGLCDVVTAGGAVPFVRISESLSVLTAGRRLHQPLAMLTSDRLRAVITDAGAQFDWVLLDTPPIGLLPDAQLVARLSEAALFVIAAGVTPYALVQKAIAELGPERLVGTVLNRVELRMLKAQHSYGGYYGTYSDEAGPR